MTMQNITDTVDTAPARCSIQQPSANQAKSSEGEPTELTPEVLAELKQAQAAHQQRVGTLPRTQPEHIGPVVGDLQGRLSDPQFQERQRQKRAELERKEAERQRSNREAAWQSLITQHIGTRYASCRVENFEIDESAEHARRATAVVCDLQAYCDDIETHVRSGHGLWLYGPMGAGKDWLLTGVLHDVVMAGFTVGFINGGDLFQKFRDAMRNGGSEEHVRKSFSTFDVLAISDPVPPKGENSQFDLRSLFGLVDVRNRNLKPTYITINVADRVEAYQRLGAQIVDRLIHDSLLLHCNWPSHRNPLTRLKLADIDARTA